MFYLLLFLIPQVLSRPQNDLAPCSEYPGYRCVPILKCKGAIGGNIEDEIFKNPTGFTDGAGVLGVRNTPAEDAPCLDVNVRSEGLICCNEDNIDDKVRSTVPEEKCSDLIDQGYSCVPKSDCSGELDPRQSLSLIEPICELESDTCCHKSKVKDSELTPKPCSAFQDKGYSCVSIDQCQKATTGIRQFDENPENAFCTIDPRQSSVRSSEDSGQVCCHIRDIKREPEPPALECKDYFRDGFSCVNENMCTDQLAKASNQFNRFEEIASTSFCESNPRDGSKQVCCLNPRGPETIGECKETEGYKCMPIQNCDLSAEIIKSDEPPLLDIRKGGILEVDHDVSLCPGDSQVCCRPKEPKKTTPKPSTPRPSTPRPPTPSPKSSPLPKCGQHNENGIAIRVSNSQEGKAATQFAEWPHVCLVHKYNSFGNKEFLGGASLIAPGVVITVAHKVEPYEPSDLVVRCGEHDLKDIKRDEFLEHQDRQVHSITIHPRYSGPKRVYNDVAVLHLLEEFKLDRHIGTICLPKTPNLRTGNYQKEKCVIMGWGKSKANDTFYQSVLKQATLPLVENAKCQTLLRATRLPGNFKLHDSFICAGGEENIDACEGDGGGPLICPDISDPNRYVLTGLIAWGIGCGEKNVPGVYAAIPDSLCFIDWATKCEHGSAYNDYYNYPQCDNWINQEISNLSSTSTLNASRYLRAAQELKKKCQGNSEISISQLGKRIQSNGKK